MNTDDDIGEKPKRASKFKDLRTYRPAMMSTMLIGIAIKTTLFKDNSNSNEKNHQSRNNQCRYIHYKKTTPNLINYSIFCLKYYEEI